MLPGIESTHESFLPMLILNEALTLTFGDDKEILVSLALLDFDLLGLAHHKLDFCDDIVFNFRVKCENQVLLQLLAEDKSGYLFLE